MDENQALNMIAGSALTMAGNIASSKLDEEATKRVMQYQRTMNIENWNMQNAYNEMIYNKYGSPSAMVRQYKEAGLNPAALAGTNGPSVGQSSMDGVSPSFDAGYDLGGSFLAGLAPALSLAKMEAEIDNINANTKNVESQTNERDTLLEAKKRLMDAQGVSQKIRNDIDSITLNIHEATSAVSIEEKRVALDEALERLSSLRYDNARKQFENAKMVERYDLWKDQALLDVAKTSADIIATDTGIKLTEQEILNVAKDRELLEEVIKKTEFDTEHQNLANQLLALENEWARANKWLYFLTKSAESGSQVASVIKTVATKGKK